MMYGRLAKTVAVATLLACASVASFAQEAPSAETQKAQDLAVPTTKVLAIGHFTRGSSPSVWRPLVDSEVRQTVDLYLAGKIEQWWVKADQSGVVFLFDLSDPKEAQKLLDQLPMGRAGVMAFELIPLGPLSPLRLLLAAPTK